mgnify:CR=1 FL=1
MAEHDLVVVFVAWRNRQVFARGHLPQDVVYLAVILILSVIVSFGAALGVSAIVFNNVFGFPGADPAVPLYGFVFLVALGVDYTIVDSHRARLWAQVLPHIVVRENAVVNPGGSIAWAVRPESRELLAALRTLGDDQGAWLDAAFDDRLPGRPAPEFHAP